MKSPHPSWPFEPETQAEPGPDSQSALTEAGALFIRTKSGITESLAVLEADAIEGLIALCRSDDWKESFIRYLLTEFREGLRASPADVLFHMRDAVDDFKMRLADARAVASDYPAFLNPDALMSDTFTSVGSGAPKDEPTGDVSKEAGIKRRIDRAAKHLAGELAELERTREPQSKPAKRSGK
jgi:hypothetical protein